MDGKVCSKCKEFKPWTEYHRCKKIKDGHKSTCKICRKKKAANRYLHNKDKINTSNREYYLQNKDKLKVTRKRYYENNKENLLAKSKEWSKNNRHRKNSYKSKRKQLKKYSTPCWYEKEQIIELYKKCKQRSLEEKIEYSVDHIIPIINENVCGLHVLSNLQIIPRKSNSSKNNFFDGTYENDFWKRGCDE